MESIEICANSDNGGRHNGRVHSAEEEADTQADFNNAETPALKLLGCSSLVGSSIAALETQWILDSVLSLEINRHHFRCCF